MSEGGGMDWEDVRVAIRQGVFKADGYIYRQALALGFDIYTLSYRDGV